MESYRLSNITDYCWYSWILPEFDSKTLLLKTAYTGVTEHGEVMLMLGLDALFLLANLIVLKDAMHDTNSEPFQLR